MEYDIILRFFYCLNQIWKSFWGGGGANPPPPKKNKNKTFELLNIES